jgi:hypothetical protein
MLAVLDGALRTRSSEVATTASGSWACTLLMKPKALNATIAMRLTIFNIK